MNYITTRGSGIDDALGSPVLPFSESDIKMYCDEQMQPGVRIWNAAVVAGWTMFLMYGIKSDKTWAKVIGGIGTALCVSSAGFRAMKCGTPI